MNNDMKNYISNLKELSTQILSDYVNDKKLIDKKIEMQHLKSMKNTDFLICLGNDNFYEIVFPAHIFISCLDADYKDEYTKNITNYIKNKLDYKYLDFSYENNENIKVFSIKDKIIKLTYTVGSYGDRGEENNIIIRDCIFAKAVTKQVTNYI